MPTKSRARRALEAALDAAVTPQEKSDAANRLSKHIEREGRDLARRRRARAAKPEPAIAVVDDGDEPFELEQYTAQITPAGAARVQGFVDEATGRFVPGERPKPLVEPVVIEPAPPLPVNDGANHTRTIQALNRPGAVGWNPVSRQWEEDADPRSSVGSGGLNWVFSPATAPVFTDTFSGGKWQSERDAEEAEANKPLDWDEQCRRAAAAAAAGRWR